MFPTITMNDFPNIALIGAKHSTNRGLRHSVLSKLSHRKNISVAKLSLRKLFAFERPFRVQSHCYDAAAFLIHIFMVIHSCTAKQMIWITARRVVAFMTDIFRAGVDAVMQPICYAVSPEVFTVNIKSTIVAAFRYGSALPYPTLVGFNNVNARPKSSFDFVSYVGKVTIVDSHSVFSYLENGLIRLGSVLVAPFRAVFIIPQTPGVIEVL